MGWQRTPREPVQGSLAPAPQAATRATVASFWSGCSAGPLSLFLVSLLSESVSVITTEVFWKSQTRAKRTMSFCFGIQKGAAGSLQVIRTMLL